MSKKYSKNWWSKKIEKELVGRKIIKVDFISTLENLADIFTKPTSKESILRLKLNKSDF